ncbi:DsrE family protein [uncultured Thiothrix sp.]|uniref:DsrE family protein n=1 Tax=uncultured Thiothrix sp. TaxID=223185 RepID=UPI002627BA8C|nr:DsrE family protein [uncultured Thiothrix sp.]
MLNKLAISLALSLSFISPLSFAESFDPGVPAPKVPADYYAGAEKLVVHVSVDGDEKKYLSILANINNYIKALDSTGKKTEAIVVMNGEGLGLLKLAKDLELENEAKLPAQVDNLKAKGVKFEICYNTLVGREIKLADLYNAKAEDVIPSGVAEVGRLEAQGYRLLKP